MKQRPRIYYTDSRCITMKIRHEMFEFHGGLPFYFSKFGISMPGAVIAIVRQNGVSVSGGLDGFDTR